ncbi:MAG: hypothetical protein R6X22_05020 [Gemmatimonadota bacterium]
MPTRVQVSMRGMAEDAGLRQRAEALLGSLPAGTDVALAKFSLERREPSTHAVAVVLALRGVEEPVVRHAASSDWEKAFLELARKLERALPGGGE